MSRWHFLHPQPPPGAASSAVRASQPANTTYTAGKAKEKAENYIKSSEKASPCHPHNEFCCEQNQNNIQNVLPTKIQLESPGAVEWEAFQKSSDFPVLVKEFRAETIREITQKREFFYSQHCQATTEHSLAQQRVSYLLFASHMFFQLNYTWNWKSRNIRGKSSKSHQTHTPFCWQNWTATTAFLISTQYTRMHDSSAYTYKKVP